MNRTGAPVVFYFMFWFNVVVVDAIAVLELHKQVLHLLLLIVSIVKNISKHRFVSPRLELELLRLQ